MIEIRRGTPEDFEETVDFLDFVFSKNSVRHDFELMFPNLYRPDAESMSHFISLYEDGKIKGSILSKPRTLSIGGERLKIYGVGSVACHPRVRGRGFMSMLMNYNNAEMEKEGVHISSLGGRRLRYNHFGYEISGYSYDTSFTDVNVRDFGVKADGDAYQFREVEAEDVAIIDKLKAIYESKPVHYEYTHDDFFLRLIIPYDGSVCYAVYSADDKSLRGYVAVDIQDKGACIGAREICLADDGEYADVLFSLALKHKAKVGVRLGEWQLPYARRILDIGDEITCVGNRMWKVMRWREVIHALLSFKSTYTAILPGELVLDIEGAGRLAVTYDGGVRVEPTDKAADFTFPGLTAVRALMGPAPRAFLQSDDAGALNIAHSWFPLPMTWFRTERA